MWGPCAQVAASARPEPAVDVHDMYEGSDEEIERQLPATESAPRGARRFSEKYSENKAQVTSQPAASAPSYTEPLRPRSCLLVSALWPSANLWPAFEQMP